jgi:hypothetical protein
MFSIFRKTICLVSFILVLVVAAGAANAGDVKINFQSNSQGSREVPDGYMPDYGEVFGDRGNGWSYGWDRDIQADARDRDSGNASDQRYDTLIHLQKAANAIWEIELTNGDYEVLLVCGDPDNTDQTNSFDVEGVILEDPTPQTGNFDEYNATVVVSDGRLTIQPGPGSANCKIMFLDILGTSPVSSSGKLTTTWGGVKVRY